MKAKRGRRLVALLVIGGAVAAGVLLRDRATSQAQAGPAQGALEASGVIQAQQVSIASEFGGRIAEVAVVEGTYVTAGDTVAQLDTGLLDGQVAVAEAMVATAEAGLAQARAGAREGQIAVAEAQRELAEAGLFAAQTAVSDTQTLVESPQDLDLQIAVLRGQLDAAREQQARAAALKDAIEVVKGEVDRVYEEFDGGGRHRFEVADGNVVDLVEDLLPEDLADRLPDDFGGNLPDTGQHDFAYGDYELHLDNGNYRLFAWQNIVFPMEAALLPNQWWQAWVGVNAASARVEGLQSQLSHLYAQRADPQSLNAQLDEIVALEGQLGAQVVMAGAQVDALRAGLSPEELAAIEARVGQAYAGLEALAAQRDMLSLTTPISGTVVDILVQEGEVAAQGAVVVSVADLADMTVTVYVPETRLGEVWLDQIVNVRVDSFAGREFIGIVSHISDTAEFTPRNVATVEERQNLVFAVDIRLDNADGDLKPGMPADVVFSPDTWMRQ